MYVHLDLGEVTFMNCLPDAPWLSGLPPSHGAKLTKALTSFMPARHRRQWFADSVIGAFVNFMNAVFGRCESAPLRATLWLCGCAAAD